MKIFKFVLSALVSTLFCVASVAQDFGSAKWIGYNPSPQRYAINEGAESRLNINDAPRVWVAPDLKTKTDDGPSIVFKWNIIVDTSSMRQAWFAAASDNWCYIRLNNSNVMSMQGGKTVLEREATEFLKNGKNEFVVEAQYTNDPKIGIAFRLVIERYDGSFKEYTFDDCIPIYSKESVTDAKCTKITGDISSYLKYGYYAGSNQSAPAPLLRKSFAVKNKPIKQATLLSSALGVGYLYINGKAVNDNVLGVAATQYDKSVLYTQDDVTSLIKAGSNAIAAMLGHGWYSHTARTTWDFDISVWADRPKLLAMLQIEYQDGEQQLLTSDSSWKAALSPIIADDFMSGEIYDARMEQKGWNGAKFNDSAWSSAEEMKAPEGILKPQNIAPMRVTERIAGFKSVEKVRDDVYRIDLGQNIVGWVEITVRGGKGKLIKIDHSESTNGNRLSYRLGEFLWNGSFQQDRYIKGSSESETWHPRMTYHGFRYVEISGLGYEPKPEDITACRINTDFESVGSFECSNEFVNKLHRATLNSYRGNFHGFPTDCPTREKKGWTGDAHLAAEQAVLNWDNTQGYIKYMDDFADIQLEDGSLNTVIPSPGWGEELIDWSVAAVNIPWNVYEYTGNEDIIKSSYDMMRSWLGLYIGKGEYVIETGLGDWVPVNSITSKKVTSTCYYYGALRRMATMGRAIGRKEDAFRYDALADRVRTEYNRQLVRNDGTVDSGTQTAQAMSLYFDIISSDMKDKVTEKLVEAVNKADDHVDVGIHGAKVLFRALSDNGHHDLAWKVLMQKEGPGYAAMMKSEESTLCETLTGAPTYNHIMFGDIDAWFYNYLAGIRPDVLNPGFKHFYLAPMPVGDLTYVKAEHKCCFGTISSFWEKREDGYYYATFVVPQGTTATLILPNGAQERLIEGTYNRTW